MRYSVNNGFHLYKQIRYVPKTSMAIDRGFDNLADWGEHFKSDKCYYLTGCLKISNLKLQKVEQRPNRL